MKKHNLNFALMILISLNTLNSFVIGKNIPIYGTHWNRIGKRFDSTKLTTEKLMEANLDYSNFFFSKNTFF